MKKLLVLIAIVLFATNGIAQKKGNGYAVKVSNEMTEVLSLTKVESAKILEIHTARIIKKKELKESQPDNKELMKTEMKKFQKQLKDVLGQEKMALWAAHVKTKK